MFLCSKRRFMWYVDRKIAEIWAGDPMSASLNFTPKGYGDPDFMLKPRMNLCVCCGTTDNLTSHHVVPLCYRKHLPSEYKDHNSYDIVLLCRKCHGRYELTAWELKKQLTRKYVPVELIERNRLITSGQKKVGALVRHAGKIPADKLEELLQKVQDTLIALNMTEQDLMMAQEENPFAYVTSIMPNDELILTWKSHFVTTAKPKFLPDWWEVDKVRMTNDTNKILYNNI
jgi:hypothetical protein